MEAREKMEADLQKQGSGSVIPTTTPLSLPKIPYDKEELTEILEEIPTSSIINKQIAAQLSIIEGKVSAIYRHQAKKNPADFYQAMKTALLEIKNAADELFRLTKNVDQTLANTLRQVILKWVTPLEVKLEKRLEMSADNRAELELKTKHLYAEQSLVSRQPDLQTALMGHLEKLKTLVLAPDKTAPRCYISYAWASPEHKTHEYWVQPFLSILYDHLTQAGIRVVMDIRDNKPGDNIYHFMERYHDGNYVILAGTESLLQKHYAIAAHAVQTELSIINNRFEQDQKQFGQSRIYPLLISGTIKTVYPEIYDKYHTVRDARDQGYLGTLKKITDWIYETNIFQHPLEHANLWNGFFEQMKGLPKEGVEQELALNYHRQRLDALRQDIQYQNVQAEKAKTNASKALSADPLVFSGAALAAIGAQQSTQPNLNTTTSTQVTKKLAQNF